MNKDQKISLSLTFLFTQWIGEKQYTKHQCNDRWYDEDVYIGTTSDMWNMFESDVDWHEFKENTETIEETAERFLLDEDLDLSDYDKRHILNVMTKIAKWQQERSYNEKDMEEYAEYYNLVGTPKSPKEWFEQFKNK